jgi:uncharacterized protein YrzB (UPF0473 family)
MIDEKKNGITDEELEELENFDEDFIVELTDEEGKTQKFSILDTIDYEGKEYAVLATDEEPDSVVILEYIENEEEGTFVTVDDEDKLQAIFDIFVSSLEDCCCCGDDCDCDGDCDCDCHEEGDHNCGCGHCH